MQKLLNRLRGALANTQAAFPDRSCRAAIDRHSASTIRPVEYVRSDDKVIVAAWPAEERARPSILWTGGCCG